MKARGSPAKDFMFFQFGNSKTKQSQLVLWADGFHFVKFVSLSLSPSLMALLNLWTLESHGPLTRLATQDHMQLSPQALLLAKSSRKAQGTSWVGCRKNPAANIKNLCAVMWAFDC
jgi:hypothetical protein